MFALDEWLDAGKINRNATFITLGRCDSGIPQTLTFADTTFHFRAALNNPNVSVIVTSSEFAEQCGGRKGSVISESPRTEFYRLHERLIPHPNYACQVQPYIAPSAVIHPSAVISGQCCVGEGVVIGPRVVVAGPCIIEDHAFIDAGAVIGAEGILYYTEEGKVHPVRHAGGVRIGKGAQILAHAVVARAIHPPEMTHVGARSIVGIASTVGHEAWLGDDVVIQGNCVLARQCVIEDGALVSSSSVVREYTRVGAGASVKAGSVVVCTVAPGAEVSGNFARDHKRHLRQSLTG